MEQSPLNQPTSRRAWEDTKHSFHSIKFFWGVEIVAMGVFIFLATVLIPENANKVVSAGYPTIGAIIGVIVGFGVIYLVMLFKAPYKQRNEARKQTLKLEEKLQPKLAVFIEHNPVLGGIVLGETKQSIFWRLGVTNISMSPILNCYSEIVNCYRISESGSRSIPEATWPRRGNGLPWGRGSGGTFEISLAGEQTTYLDYIMLPNRQSGILVVPTRPNSPNDRPDYKSYPIAHDNLEFEIAVGSKGQTMERSVIKFTFEWKGGSNATITELENTSQSTCENHLCPCEEHLVGLVIDSELYYTQFFHLRLLFLRWWLRIYSKSTGEAKLNI